VSWGALRLTLVQDEGQGLYLVERIERGGFVLSHMLLVRLSILSLPPFPPSLPFLFP